MSRKISPGCIVVFDDGMMLCMPMGWDEDEPDTLCAGGISVAFFDSRTAARKAIARSRALAMLRRARGQIHNNDFLAPASACLRVVSLRGPK